MRGVQLYTPIRRLYDLETGKQLANDLVLPTYDVVLEDGVGYVDGQRF